ncbi:hypothetical protein BH09PSE4_BH09PSE4_10620 [soil metagenome]
MAIATALRWAEEKRDWIARQREQLPDPRPFAHAARIPVGDALLTVDWEPSRPRRVEQDGQVLRCGGPAEGLSRRIEAWLKCQALALLSEETAFYAAKAGVHVTKVAIGDPKSRWGSCASSGVIRYSWRLILAPPHVRRATVAHEVAHRVHMHHGPEFHALVALLYGSDPSASRRWLKANGASLHWFGRDS